MTRRRLIALFLAWHLFAISIAALPPPNRLSHFPPRQSSDALNPFFYGVTVALDTAARGTEAVEKVIWRATRPLHRPISYYVRLTGLSQTWSMFANPPTYAQYIRVRYYVQPDQGRAWAATELVYPAHREDRVRMFQSFRDSYQDKALSVALGRFLERRKPTEIQPGTRPDQLPRDFAPVARYFTKRFVAQHVGGGEQMVRTEVWVGTAPIPPLGTPAQEDARFERAVVLQAYYDGPIEQRLNVPSYPPYHAGEREADIAWMLEYYEER